MKRQGLLTIFPFGQREQKTNISEEPGIFLPAKRRIGACVTHRPDIIWIDASCKKEEVVQTLLTNPSYEFFPVCAGTVDSVLGILSARAVFESISLNSWNGLKPLVKKPVYLPETATIHSALVELETAGCRMAFIIDEYGGIEGIVTRNGLVKELLEEIDIGNGEDDPDIFKRPDGSYLIGGHVRMHELTELLTLDEDEHNSTEYYTLAGYLLSIRGNIPRTGDIILSGTYTFEIIDMDGHRIDKVLVSQKNEQNDLSAD